jgi:hypothetical protein
MPRCDHALTSLITLRGCMCYTMTRTFKMATHDPLPLTNLPLPSPPAWLNLLALTRGCAPMRLLRPTGPAIQVMTGHGPLSK